MPLQATFKLLLLFLVKTFKKSFCAGVAINIVIEQYNRWYCSVASLTNKKTKIETDEKSGRESFGSSLNH
jgi:hypothetical protein